MTIEARFRMLSTDELKQAFKEYSKFRQTAVMPEGIITSVYNDVSKDGAIISIPTLFEPLLFVLAERLLGVD